MADGLQSSYDFPLAKNKAGRKWQTTSLPIDGTALLPDKAIGVQGETDTNAMNPDEHRILWLQLALSRGVGPVTFWRLLKKTHGNLEQACAAVRTLTPRARAEEELANHEQHGFQLIFADEPQFPQKLLQLRDCPPFLSFVGDPTLLNRPSVAVVGARNASIHGKQFGRRIAQNLGENGLVIVSGLARGIDGAAHEGGLETGSLAVLAGGLDIVYPPENEPLYAQLKEQGGILSEMPLGTAIEPALFPRRNRIIAGLSDGVILIEAAAHSGTLITAQYAIDTGKEVFAVPGFPSDPRSYGCNQLLKHGATLTESANDVLSSLTRALPQLLQVLKPDRNHNQCGETGKAVLKTTEAEVAFGTLEGDASLKDIILQEMSPLPVSIETLFQSLNCSLPHLLNLLTELESEGKISRHANNDISLSAV